jgi:ABC-2 type transport system ATP-binding protein
MRCEVAATFLHQPKVVYLDEPTIGLDMDAKRSIRTFIQAMVETLGTSVILTTHDLGDIEELCQRVILIDHGQIVYDGQLSRLRERYAGSKTVQADVPPEARERVTAAIALGAPHAQITVSGGVLRVAQIGDDRAIAGVAQTLLGDAAVKNLTINEPRVEEIIRNVFTENVAVPTPAPVPRVTQTGVTDAIGSR